MTVDCLYVRTYNSPCGIVEIYHCLVPINFVRHNGRTKLFSKESINQMIQLLGYKREFTGHNFLHIMSIILYEEGFNSEWIEM